MPGGATVVAELAVRVRSSPARAGRTRVVAIDGRSGAGKTTFAEGLAALLQAPVVQLEQLYPGWDGLQAGIDLLVSDVLEPLAEGRAAAVPRYDWRQEQWVEPWTLEPPDVLVVEGVGAGARASARYASVLVWIELDAAARKRRALERDKELFRPHWARWEAQEADLLARELTPHRADLVVDGSNLRDLRRRSG